MNAINELWNSRDESDWKAAFNRYWDFVQPKNLSLERELNDLTLEQIAGLDPIGWYDFLHDKYFRWKYTAPNRYATTTSLLRRHKESHQLDRLFDIKKKLLTLDVSQISTALSIAKEIHGLGVAGASGLLSILYRQTFATVDQFVVKALCQISDLPERAKLERMKPESLTLADGRILTEIMQRKARENNQNFVTDFWTPRKIDMVLWASR